MPRLRIIKNRYCKIYRRAAGLRARPRARTSRGHCGLRISQRPSFAQRARRFLAGWRRGLRRRASCDGRCELRRRGGAHVRLQQLGCGRLLYSGREPRLLLRSRWRRSFPWPPRRRCRHRRWGRRPSVQGGIKSVASASGSSISKVKQHQQVAASSAR